MRILHVSILVAVLGGSAYGCGGKVVLDSPAGTGGAGFTTSSGNTGGGTVTVSSNDAGGGSFMSSGSFGGGGSSSTDPICSNPNAMVSEACIACLQSLTGNAPCVTTFSMECEASAQCVAYAECTEGCQNKAGSGTGGAGGGSTMCAANPGAGGSGGATSNCDACCITSNQEGVLAYNTDLINACICMAGAPCGAACAM